MYDIVTIGSATRDAFLRSRGIKVIPTRAFPIGKAQAVPLGGKVTVDDLVFETGGAGTNTAVAFARLGFRTAFLGKLGAFDPGGREVVRQLEAEGVTTKLVRRDRQHVTAYSIVLLTSKGERTVLVYRGAAGHLHPREIPATRVARWFYLSALGGDLPLLRRVFSVARQHRIRLAWNPGSDELAHGQQRLRPFLNQAGIVFLNEEETSQLTGVPLSQPGAAFRKLCAWTSAIVVVTAGNRGAVACDDRHHYAVIPSRVKAKNRTGAGDAFGSGFVAGWLRRPGDIRFALQVGTANAESVIQTFGAKRGLLRRIPRPSRLSRIRTVPNRERYG